jgi:hypothetical protein
MDDGRLARLPFLIDGYGLPLTCHPQEPSLADFPVVFAAISANS